MKLHVLIDNLASQDNPALHHEHGLSLLLQAPEGKNILIDTGASGKFLENLETLRQADSTLPSAEEIDAVIISHGHNDHTGGLRSFLEANTTAKVYLHSSIQGNLYFSCRNRGASTTSPGIMEARSIGMEQSLFAEYGHRFVQISQPLSLSGKITLIPTGESAGSQPMPLGNKYLYKNDFPDDFSHELAVYAEFAPEQYAVISPCSHRGILNILPIGTSSHGADSQKTPIRTSSHGADSQKTPIRTSSHGAIYFIGGLHYVDYLNAEDAKKEATQIVQAAEYINEHYPNLKVFSGHCTGNDARQVLQNSLKGKYTHFSTGTVIGLK